MELPSNHEDLRAEVNEKLKKLLLNVIPADQPLALQLLKMDKGTLNFSELSKSTPALSQRAWEQIRKGLFDWKEACYEGYLDDVVESKYVAFMVQRNFQALKDALS